ncbi:DUF4347 domain-containing protein [Chlorobaculum sp. 24CR]|uniref:DUF4347 domain-containing protein n=1 Tax=Chlorobaculum sp. 24CR TaxID=2508878 RepID=UPI00100C1E2F|nr:DUF4347 domain-containing protein [Chlorobaculum sp. 24CR]RXK88459.1 DUF4347 domain-containing protein [Chlorobaculum sp. 24CR]
MSTSSPHFRDLLIADASVTDIEQLLVAAAPGTEVWRVDAGSDVRQMLRSALRSGVERLHLLGHGAAGSINFGSRSLGLDEFTALARGRDGGAPSMHFWSCMTGAGTEGRRFVDGIAKLFSTAVTAFSGLVGAKQLGGSWTPDVLVASDGVTAPFVGTPAYAHTLAEYEEPSGYFSVELVEDTNPDDTIVATFSVDSDSGYVSDLDGDGEIDFLRVFEDGDDDPDDYYITWSDDTNWTAHRIEYLQFGDHDADHKPHTLIVDGGSISIEWAETVVDSVVATASFSVDGDEAQLSFIDNNGDGIPDQVRYEGSDGSELFDIPGASWQFDSDNPVSAWAVVVETEDSDRLFSGMMEFDGDGNPVTLLVPKSGEDGDNVYFDNDQLFFDSGVDGVTIPDTGDATITHITPDGVRETVVIPVSSLSAEGSMLSLPLSGDDVDDAHYELNLEWFSMLRIEVPDGLLDEGNMRGWKLDGESGDNLHFSSFHVSSFDGSGDRDWLFGTPGEDSMDAGNDSDFIEWSGGDDTVDGGEGHDTLYLPWNESDGYVSTSVNGGIYYLSSSVDGKDRYSVTRLDGENVLLVEQLDDDGNPVSSVQFTNGEVLRVAYNWELSVSNQEMNDSGYINASPWDDEIVVSVDDDEFDDLFQVWGNYGDDTLQLDFGTEYSGFSLQDNGSAYELYGTPVEGGGDARIGEFVRTSPNEITVSIDGHSFHIQDVEHFRFVGDQVSLDSDIDNFWHLTTDTAPPSLTRAVASGNTVTLHYDETLDSAYKAGANWFTVQVNGSDVDVNSIEVSGSDVVLSLDSSIQTGDSVSVSYADPSASNDADAIQDLAGNDAGSFTDYVASVEDADHPARYYPMYYGYYWKGLVYWGGDDHFQFELYEDYDDDFNTMYGELTWIDQEDGHERVETGTFTAIDTNDDWSPDAWQAEIRSADDVPLMGDDNDDGKPDGFYIEEGVGVNLVWQLRGADGVVATFEFAADDVSLSGSLLDLDGDGSPDYARVTENGLSTMQQIALLDTNDDDQPDTLQVVGASFYTGALEFDPYYYEPTGIWFDGVDHVENGNNAAPELSLDNAELTIYNHKLAGMVAGADADATDADGNLLVFTLDNPPTDDSDNPLFAIDAETGQISLTEAGATYIQSADLSDTFDLTVRVTDGDTTHDQTADLVISLKDEPDSYDFAVNVYYWPFAWGIPDVTVMMTGESSNETPGQSLGGGEYDFGALEEGEYTLTATRAADADENDFLITEDDAEAAFELALGGTAESPYQYLAADIDRDGTVGFRDTLGILKMALGREDAPEPEWVFVPESVSYEEMSSDKTSWPVTLGEDTVIDMVGVLLGNVELTWW